MGYGDGKQALCEKKKMIFGRFLVKETENRHIAEKKIMTFG